jgi:hypothetical protein
MRHCVKTLIASALLAGVLFGGLSSVAAGMLLCVGDGTAYDCCGNSKSTPLSSPSSGGACVTSADCDCCIAVDALPSICGASSQRQASLDLVAGPVLFRTVAPASSPRFVHALSGDGGDEQLSLLRRTVLLV